MPTKLGVGEVPEPLSRGLRQLDAPLGIVETEVLARGSDHVVDAGGDDLVPKAVAPEWVVAREA
jgi:hypothetical protein